MRLEDSQSRFWPRFLTHADLGIVAVLWYLGDCSLTWTNPEFWTLVQVDYRHINLVGPMKFFEKNRLVSATALGCTFLAQARVVNWSRHYSQGIHGYLMVSPKRFRRVKLICSDGASLSYENSICCLAARTVQVYHAAFDCYFHSISGQTLVCRASCVPVGQYPPILAGCTSIHIHISPWFVLYELQSRWLQDAHASTLVPWAYCCIYMYISDMEVS